MAKFNMIVCFDKQVYNSKKTAIQVQYMFCFEFRTASTKTSHFSSIWASSYIFKSVVAEKEKEIFAL